MAITLQVDFCTPIGVAAPSGSYVRPGLAIADIALALTRNKLLVEASGAPEDVGLRTTLKAVRDIANYQKSETGWTYQDGNIQVRMLRDADWTPRTTPQIWVDSDGVFAAFDQQVETITGRTVAELGDDQMWKLCGPRQDFWDTMPVLAGAHRLWEAIKSLNPIVLTGCPKTDYDLAADRKRAWWKRNFDHDDVFTCLSKDKAQFIELPNDILIDDFIRNIKAFRAAGGIGILHRSVDETIEQLQRLGVIA